MARIRLIDVSLIAGGLEATVDVGTPDVPPLSQGARVRLAGVALIAGGLEADVERLDGPAPPPPPPPPEGLPDGFDRDRRVGLDMLRKAMDAAGLDPIGVQGHGAAIVAALKKRWPGLDVYLSPSDAPVWPGFGSLDVTIDSGKLGWQFRPDDVTPYEPDPSKRP